MTGLEGTDSARAQLDLEATRQHRALRWFRWLASVARRLASDGIEHSEPEHRPE